MARQKTATRGKSTPKLSAELPTDETLKAIATLVTRQLELQSALEKKEEEYNVLVKQLRVVQEDLLPSLMQEVGLKTITLSDGHSVKITGDISVSVTQDRKEACYAWLKDQGAEAIIKKEVTLTFDRGEIEEFNKCTGALSRFGYTPSVKESIHAATLKATLKEFMAKAVDVPLSLFGAVEYSKAVIK